MSARVIHTPSTSNRQTKSAVSQCRQRRHSDIPGASTMCDLVEFGIGGISSSVNSRYSGGMSVRSATHNTPQACATHAPSSWSGEQDVNRSAPPLSFGRASTGRLIIVVLLCFLLGLVASLILNNWRNLLDLYVEANLVRYEAMTSELSGPTDYWVFHSDIDAVRRVVQTEDAITKLEPTSLDTLVVLSFTSARDPAVSRLREHPAITAIMSTSIPLFCH